MEFTLDELRKIYDALTPELIRYLELTDGKMPKDGKRIALVVEKGYEQAVEFEG